MPRQLGDAVGFQPSGHRVGKHLDADHRDLVPAPPPGFRHDGLDEHGDVVPRVDAKRPVRRQYVGVGMGRVQRHEAGRGARRDDGSAEEYLGDTAAGGRPGQVRREALEITQPSRRQLGFLPSGPLAVVGATAFDRRGESLGDIGKERLLNLVERLRLVESQGEHPDASSAKAEREHRPVLVRSADRVVEVGRLAGSCDLVDRRQDCGAVVLVGFAVEQADHRPIGLDLSHGSVEPLDHVLRVDHVAEDQPQPSRPLGELEAAGVVDRGTDQRCQLLQRTSLGIDPEPGRRCGDGQETRISEQVGGDLVTVLGHRLALGGASELEPRVGRAEETAGLLAHLGQSLGKGRPGCDRDVGIREPPQPLQPVAVGGRLRLVAPAAAVERCQRRGEERVHVDEPIDPQLDDDRPARLEVHADELEHRQVALASQSPEFDGRLQPAIARLIDMVTQCRRVLVVVRGELVAPLSRAGIQLGRIIHPRHVRPRPAQRPMARSSPSGRVGETERGREKLVDRPGEQAESGSLALVRGSGRPTERHRQSRLRETRPHHVGRAGVLVTEVQAAVQKCPQPGRIRRVADAERRCPRRVRDDDPFGVERSREATPERGQESRPAGPRQPAPRARTAPSPDRGDPVARP